MAYYRSFWHALFPKHLQLGCLSPERQTPTVAQGNHKRHLKGVISIQYTSTSVQLVKKTSNASFNSQLLALSKALANYFRRSTECTMTGYREFIKYDLVCIEHMHSVSYCHCLTDYDTIIPRGNRNVGTSRQSNTNRNGAW